METQRFICDHVTSCRMGRYSSYTPQLRVMLAGSFIGQEATCLGKLGGVEVRMVRNAKESRFREFINVFVNQMDIPIMNGKS